MYQLIFTGFIVKKGFIGQNEIIPRKNGFGLFFLLLPVAVNIFVKLSRKILCQTSQFATRGKY